MLSDEAGRDGTRTQRGRILRLLGGGVSGWVRRERGQRRQALAMGARRVGQGVRRRARLIFGGLDKWGWRLGLVPDQPTPGSVSACRHMMYHVTHWASASTGSV